MVKSCKYVKEKSKLQNDTYTIHIFQTKVYESIININVHTYMLRYTERRYWGAKTMRLGRSTKKF